MTVQKLALTLLLTTSILQPIAALNGYIPPPATNNDDGPTLLLVGYTDEAAHETIVAQTKQMQLKGKKVKERNYHKFQRAHEVRSEQGGSKSKQTKSKSKSKGHEEQQQHGNLFTGGKRRYLKEGALTRGYSVLEYDNLNTNTIELEMEALRQIPGVVAVELDGVAHIMTTDYDNKQEKKRKLVEEKSLLRGGGGIGVDHMKEIQEAIRTTADQLSNEEGEDATSTASDASRSQNDPNVEQGRRRLAERIPYGINMVNSQYVHDQTGTPPPNTPKIKICVVDTGYELGHEDLPDADPNNHNTSGFSPYGGNENWFEDGNGHGTHCAGTIGAIGGNDKGVTSVNPNPDQFEFLIGKGLRNGGTGTMDGVMQAVDWCVGQGAKVVSMSLGGGGYSVNENSQFEEHYDNNVLIIAAAGNGGNSVSSYPASYPSVVSIGAVNSNKQIASFSQYNDQVELSAPGVGVESTYKDNSYEYLSGTSMATPHVAGVAALLWYHFPECNNNQIRNAMIYSAEDRGGQDSNGEAWDRFYGWGIVDAEAAYERLKDGCVSAGGPYPGPDQSLSSMAPGGKYQRILVPTPAPTPFPTNEGDSGPQSASYDALFQAPKCSFGSSCDSGALFNGRGSMSGGIEPNRPNTLNACTDGNSGTYGVDESIDKIVVSQAPGITKDMAAGDTVTITATVFCWSAGTSDFIDFYYASDAANPNWNQIGQRQPCPGGGVQTVTASYTLPSEGSDKQAVRVNLMYQSNPPGAGSCTQGNWDDVDDLVISVVNGPTPPPTSQPSSKPTTPMPTNEPTTASPTSSPTSSPSQAPTTAVPTNEPTSDPTAQPTHEPTPMPSSSPTSSPTARPSPQPSPQPTSSPTGAPSKPPGKSPTKNFSNSNSRNANQKAKGIMFQIKAKDESDVIIEKMSFKTKDNKQTEVQIYFQPGSYSTFASGGLNRNVWDDAVFDGIPSSISGGLMEVVFDNVLTIPAGTMGSFYLAGKKEFMYEQGSSEFDVADDTGDFITHTGSSQKKPFEQEMKKANFVGGIAFHTFTEATDPTSSPTNQPTSNPTASPSQNPTQQPTSSPSQAPTTAAPTAEPTTASPSSSPTSQAPTTAVPTNEPTSDPTAQPTHEPTSAPSQSPTTAEPTNEPSKSPTAFPTSSPSKAPTNEPTTANPTSNPTNLPTSAPSKAPTDSPTSGVTDKEFTTGLNDANQKAKGVMFSFTSMDTKDVIITGIGIIGAKTKESEVNIFKHTGSYGDLENPLNSNNWEEVYSNNKLMLNQNEIKNIVLQEAVNVPAGSTVSLYVYSKNGLMYSKASNIDEHDSYAESDDFSLNVGQTTKKEFQQFQGKMAKFAGRFEYEA